MEGLLQTEKEKERKKKHEEVCRLFLLLRERYPESKPYRIFHTIASEMKLSVPAIVQICVDNGYYQPIRRKEEEHDTRATQSEPYGTLQR